MSNLFFIDCEATGPCPGKGELTEFGAAHYDSRDTFHGVLFESKPNPENPAQSIMTGKAFDQTEVFSNFEKWINDHISRGGRPIFVSDNPAYDFQWINYGFHHAIGRIVLDGAEK